MTVRNCRRGSARLLTWWPRPWMLLLGLALSLPAGRSDAGVITLAADRDNNLLKSTFSGTGSGRQINNVNLGGQPRFAVGISGGDDNRSVISFDVSPLAAQYLWIDAVTMRLSFNRNNLTQNYTKPFDVEVYQISTANADWVEGTGMNDGGPGDDAGSTWREKDRGLADWAGGDGSVAGGGLTSPGIDYDTTLLAGISSGITLPAENAVFDFNFTGTSAELTSLVDDLLLSNTGFLMLTPTTGLVNNRDRMFFHTREATDPAVRPLLIVEFTAVPEPSSWLLLWAAAGACCLLPLRRRHGGPG